MSVSVLLRWCPYPQANPVRLRHRCEYPLRELSFRRQTRLSTKRTLLAAIWQCCRRSHARPRLQIHSAATAGSCPHPPYSIDNPVCADRRSSTCRLRGSEAFAPSRSTTCSLLIPASSNRLGRIKRVGVVNFTLAVVPLHETYATSVNQIYCGYYLNHLVKVSC